MDLQNVGTLPQHYTASQSRRPRLEIVTCLGYIGQRVLLQFLSVSPGEC
jgi:hypothetical protein